jgi:protein TonB
MRVSSGVVAGNKLSGSTPVYPPIARAAHVSGAVVLHAIISKEGTIKNLTAISGPEMLKSAAISAVETWRYKPYILNGEPTEVETTVTVNFNFGGG